MGHDGFKPLFKLLVDPRAIRSGRWLLETSLPLFNKKRDKKMLEQALSDIKDAEKEKQG